jgi:UrcA family protein
MLRSKLSFGSLFLSAGLMILSATDVPAHEIQTTSVNVHTADLNLTSLEGRLVLDARISHAVNQICGDAHARSTWDQANYANCATKARAEVQAKVDATVAAAENAHRMAGGGGMPAGLR